jgi:polyisoprenoid-binding protein YceI
MHIYLLSSLILGVIGCDTEAPEGEVADVPTTEAPATPPPPVNVDVPLPELPEGNTVAVSVELSKIHFTGAKFTGSHDGGFERFDGAVVLSDDEVVATKFEIDMSSTTADNAKLAKHLMGKDFFKIEKYPKATFVSSEVAAASDPGAVTHTVKGVLDFHGKKRPLSFPATVAVGETAITVSATFDINRQNWDLAYPGKSDDLIKDDVQIRLDLNFPTPSAPKAE